MSHQLPQQQTVIVNEQPKNSLGLAGFITSLVAIATCGILSPIALILSLVGLLKKPKGFAIAGTLISGAQLALALLIGITPILAIVGIGVATQEAQKEAFQEKREALVETLGSTEDAQAVLQIELQYGFVADEEFKTLIERAKKRVPLNPELP